MSSDFESLRECHFGIFLFPRWTIFRAHALHQVFLPQERLSATANESVLLGVLPQFILFHLCSRWVCCPLPPAPLLGLLFDPLLGPFPGMDMAARQRRFEIRVFLLLDELPSLVKESHIPGAAGCKATDSPVPLLLSV